jgi:hypothetical protein
VKRKLDSFGVKSRVELTLDEQGSHRRRIVTIHGKSSSASQSLCDGLSG